ncbi:MAG: thiosulfate oxidation carrier protein SoxY [Gammaproteobacteria bacterium]|nr:thiosulfate oxidation carrier protein SoxY [Gammaproteobacteria bacterium]MCF6230485.1 thiosulfate oxidation carrier protein SoxY [Gammaproteobacteria bacterium]
MSFSRRQFIKRIAALLPLAVLPHNLFAAWPKQAFAARTIGEALVALYGDEIRQPSDKINMKLDKRVESGESIPVIISTTLSDVQSISLFVAENRPPLAATFYFDPLGMPYVATRLKLSRGSAVTAVIKTSHGLYSQQKEIKIIEGGCI